MCSCHSAAVCAAIPKNFYVLSGGEDAATAVHEKGLGSIHICESTTAGLCLVWDEVDGGALKGDELNERPPPPQPTKGTSEFLHLLHVLSLSIGLCIPFHDLPRFSGIVRYGVRGWYCNNSPPA